MKTLTKSIGIAVFALALFAAPMMFAQKGGIQRMKNSESTVSRSLNVNESIRPTPTPSYTPSPSSTPRTKSSSTMTRTPSSSTRSVSPTTSRNYGTGTSDRPRVVAPPPSASGKGGSALIRTPNTNPRSVTSGSVGSSPTGRTTTPPIVTGSSGSAKNAGVLNRITNAKPKNLNVNTPVPNPNVKGGGRGKLLPHRGDGMTIKPPPPKDGKNGTLTRIKTHDRPHPPHNPPRPYNPCGPGYHRNPHPYSHTGWNWEYRWGPYPYPHRCGPFTSIYLQEIYLVEQIYLPETEQEKTDFVIPDVSDIWSVCSNMDEALNFLRNSVQYAYLKGIYDEEESQVLLSDIEAMQGAVDALLASDKIDAKTEAAYWREQIEPLIQRVWYSKGNEMVVEVFNVRPEVQLVDGVFQNIQYRLYDTVRITFTNLSRLMRIAYDTDTASRELAESIAKQYFK